MGELSLMLLLLFHISFLHCQEIKSPPEIFKQPSTKEIFFEDNVALPLLLECEARGKPAFLYNWHKDGQPFLWQTYSDRITQQPGRGTLLITQPRNEDVGLYQCFAQNELGTAASNSVFLRKTFLNSFEPTPPIILMGTEGKPFKLACDSPGGSPKPKLSWMMMSANGALRMINNPRITADPEGTLWFSNLNREDGSEEFVYVCAAQSPVLNEYKMGNRVILKVVPSAESNVTAQYLSKEHEVATRGNKVELFCIFGGNPLPEVVWSKNGHRIKSSDRITLGNYGKSLIISKPDFEDEGIYTCHASNGVNEDKSHSITLQVLAAPFFTEEPQSIKAAQGQTVELRCAVSSRPEASIQWIHNGIPVEGELPYPRRKVGPNSIVIERVAKEDIGNYGCNASNFLGYVYKDVFINVLATPPVIKIEDAEAVGGQEVTVLCEAFSIPNPECKLTCNGQVLTGDRHIMLDNGTLLITDVNFKISGQYTCHVINEFGAMDQNCSVVVRQHTEIEYSPDDYEVAAGKHATFRCTPKHDDNLEIAVTWLNNGEEINFKDEPRFVLSSDYSLTVLKAVELDSGIYTCVAKTILDQVKAEASLIVQDVPNAPQIMAIECNKQTASLYWRPLGDNRAPIARYIIEFSSSVTSNQWEVVNGSVPAYDIDNFHIELPFGANTIIRVKAVNKIGTSSPSAPSEACVTPPTVPHRNPANVDAEGDKPGNLVISWTPIPKIEHNGPGFYYRVFWKKDMPGDVYETRWIEDWSKNHIVVDNLVPSTRYRVKVISANDLGKAHVAPQEVLGISGAEKK